MKSTVENLRAHRRKKFPVLVKELLMCEGVAKVMLLVKRCRSCLCLVGVQGWCPWGCLCLFLVGA